MCGLVPGWPASTVCRLAIRCAAWRGSVFTPVGTGHGNRCHTPRPGSPAPMCVDVAGRQPIAGSAGPRPDAAQDPGATTTRRRTSAADSSWSDGANYKPALQSRVGYRCDIEGLDVVLKRPGSAASAGGVHVRHSTTLSCRPNSTAIDVTHTSVNPQGMIRSNARRSGSTLSAKPCIVVLAATRTPIAAILRSKPVIVRCQPDARAAADSTRAQAVLGQHGDHGLFESPYVIDDPH